jgi:RNA polymerase sigma-B factor
MQDLGRAALHEQRRLTQALGREADPSEVASALGENETDVVEALTARNAYRAEHLEWDSDEDGEHPRPLSDGEGEFDRIEDRLVLASVIRRLPPRERRILILRFEHEMTQAVIAEHLQISQMHVSRLLGAALARLRQLLTQAPDTVVACSDPERPAGAIPSRRRRWRWGGQSVQ